MVLIESCCQRKKRISSKSTTEEQNIFKKNYYESLGAFVFGKNRKAKLAARAFEESLYEIVASELRAGIKKDGLWLKSVSKSRGNDDLVQSVYIELRIQSLKDEIEVSALAYETNTNDISSAPACEKVHVPTRNICERVSDAMDSLQACGYTAQEKGKGWIITNLKGGQMRCHDVKDLENYVVDVRKSQGH